MIISFEVLGIIRRPLGVHQCNRQQQNASQRASIVDPEANIQV
jgi:hypothetical protein